MNNKKFILFAFIFIFHYAYSQSTYITATVKDTTTNTPLAYCSVIIKNASDSIIRSVYTADNGTFEIGVSKNTQGKVIISMVGYDSRTYKLDEARKWKKNTIIYLKPSVEQLKEVTVTEKAAPVVRKFDKTVYTISDTLKKSAQNVYDILKTLPGVVVDEQTRTIRFKGGNPEVTVNNMPAQYVFPKLEMVKIDDIEAIELIDKASLYGGEGSEGIINIKIKTQPKMQRYGLFLSEENSYMPSKNKFPLNDHFIGVNAMMPLLIFNNLGYKQTLEGYDLYKTGTLTRSNDVFSLYNKSSLLSNDKKLFNYAGIALPSDMITVLLVYGIETNKINTNNQLYSNYNNNQSASLQWLTSTDKMAVKTTYYLGMLSFQTPKGHAFQFNYTRADEKGEDNLAANYRSMDTTEVTYPYSYFGKEAGKTELLQSFLAFMIKKNTRLNLHGSYFGSKMHNNERKYYINDVLYLPNSNAASGIQYRWKVGTNFGTRWNRLKLDATLDYIIDRIDMSYTRYTLQQDTILKVNRNIRAWSPSARLTYNPNKKDEFNAGYNFTNKPYMGEQALSFVDKQNPTEWKSGNPNLQPEYYHKIYSSFKHYTDSFNYSIELFYSLTQNGITNILYPIAPGIYLNRPENIAFNQRIGSDWSLLKYLSNRFKVKITSSVFHTYYRANELHVIAQSYGIENTKISKRNIGSFVNLYFSYKINTPKEPSYFGIWLNYYSKEITFTGYNKEYFDIDLAVSKRFFNNKLFLNIAFQNILKAVSNRKMYENYMNQKSVTNKLIFEEKTFFRVYIYYFLNDISTATKDLTPKMFE